MIADEDNAEEVLKDFCRNKLTRTSLLRHLVKDIEPFEIDKLRSKYRPQILEEIQEQRDKYMTKQFPRVDFLKRFILYDGIHQMSHEH